MSHWRIDELLPQIKTAYEKEGLAFEWGREHDAVREALFHIAGNLPAGRFKGTRVLGVGGSGIAIHLADTLLPAAPRALKFPRPVPGRVAIISEMLEKEIAYLSRLRHPSVVRILDYDVAQNVKGY